ncbi:DUF1707 domain-containing protein [Mycolicibacterium sp. GCM10028919]|uniref:DUF1707 domain-containing protein n=1 Tax=Mycolicibacterium sp. GCM10028919 TaxID=3273401 RepID=UPI003610CF8E
MTAPTTNTSAVRVGDRDREATATRLGQALAQGYLDMTEYECRVESAFTAQSRADLDALLADLPVHRMRLDDPARRAARNAAARLSVRLHLAAYALMVVIVLTVWLAVALSGGTWYFWPIWPILGAGIGVVGHVLPTRLAVRSPRCRRTP